MKVFCCSMSSLVQLSSWRIVALSLALSLSVRWCCVCVVCIVPPSIDGEQPSCKCVWCSIIIACSPFLIYSREVVMHRSTIDKSVLSFDICNIWQSRRCTLIFLTLKRQWIFLEIKSKNYEKIRKLNKENVTNNIRCE